MVTLVLNILVALRKESVDRNARCRFWALSNVESLSARRAWIEILIILYAFIGVLVALRKESVDRNMWWGVRKAVGSLVALRKESVDRNQGVHYDNYNLHWSLSARRAWIEILFRLT